MESNKERMISSPENIMTISNLIPDCLENIFERLSLEDLLNISVSSSKLKDAACSVFKRSYGKMLIVIYTSPPSINIRANIFEGTTSIKAILKNFGSSITKLCLNYDVSSHQFDKFVEDAIISCCATLTTELYINNCHSQMMLHLDKTFSNIRTVKFMYGQLSAEISCFDKHFPLVEHLTLNTEFSPDCIQYRFKSLSVLEVCNSTLTTESIVTFVSLNPQLQVMKLEHHDSLPLNAEFLRFISKRLLNLEVLGLSYPISESLTPNDNCEQRDVEFESLKKLILRVGTADIIHNIPLRLAKLLKLIILRYPNGKLIDFLSKALQMKTLTLRIYERYMIQLAKIFPNLRNIFLHTPDVITNLHFIRDRDVSPIKSKYLKYDDHTPTTLTHGVLTTTYLIPFMTSRTLHINTNYKLTPDFPVTRFGVTDLEGRFAPIGLAMTDDYKFIFSAIRNTILHFKLEVLVSDADPEIQMAAQNVFGDFIWETGRNGPRNNSALQFFFDSIQVRIAEREPVSVLREYMERCSKECEIKMIRSAN